VSEDRPKEPALRPGADVDNYKVVRLVGRGGMGEVYLARDTVLGRKVALKVLLPDALGDRESIDQFLFEARVTARFSHPHIVAIYGVGEHNGRPYVALEYLEGQTLRDRIRESRLGVIEAARAALAVSEALTEAHAHKILHRDLKPANVLIPQDGRLRVVDFGLAKALSERASVFEYQVSEERETPMPDEFDPAAARMSQLMGTPAYMAPEQWTTDEPLAASDVWALGVMLYEMLTGARPYNERTVYLQCAAVCSKDPPPPMEVDEEIPQALSEIVFACLEKDPSKRPPASEVTEALHNVVYKRARLEGEVSPFRGLLPFTERHAELFFGRDDEVAAFLERLRDDSVLAVVGPSGAGKSSFVQAGVIPRLREQGRWVVLGLRPGREPFEALASRVARGESEGFAASLAGASASTGDRSVRSRTSDRTRRLAEEQQLQQQLLDSPGMLSLQLHQLAEKEGARILLFVDQLEELYTLVDDEEVRRGFMAAVAEAADDAEGPVRVVLTLRDDFMVRLAETPQARQALQHVAVLRSPGPDALREILVKPLEQVGYRYEDPSLVDAMVGAVGGEPACLPLLQFAASRLWEERDRGKRVLRRSVYEAMGGVEGALARQADRTLEGLTPEQVAVARDILLRLVTPEGARRIVPRDELVGGAGPEASEIVDRLIRERTLLVRKGSGGAPGAEVELVHESLIRGWDRLRHWIEDSREELSFLAEAEQAAELWQRRGCRVEEVWQGDALNEATRKAERLFVAPDSVRRFLEAGQRLERRRARRKRVAVAGGMVALLLTAVASLVIALTLADKEERAQQQRMRAEERRAEALLEGARAALARGDQHESRAKLRGSLEVTDSALGRALWWTLTQEPLAWKGAFPSTVYDISYAPDGRRIAVAHLTNAVSVIDIDTREVQSLRSISDQVVGVAFAGDGRRLAYGTWDGSIGLWDTEQDRAELLSPGKSVLWRMEFQPGGDLLATVHADSIVRLWDTAKGGAPRELAGHTAEVSALAFSADGERIATGGFDNQVIIWSAKDGRRLQTLTGHTDAVMGLGFSPDGQRLVSASIDRTLRVWNLADGTTTEVLRGHGAGVYAAVFARDGSQVFSAAYDRTVRAWRPGTGERPRTIGRHDAGEIECLDLSPDGRFLASGGFDRTLRIWDLSVHAGEERGHGHTTPVWNVAASSDGETLASGGRDGTIRLWDVSSGEQTATLETDAHDVYFLDFSPDGKLLAAASADRALHVWNHEQITDPEPYDGSRSWLLGVSFSPDGKMVAAAGDDRMVRVWDVASGDLLREMKGHTAEVRGLAFHPDGQTLASAAWDNTVRIWGADGEPLQTLEGHTGWLYAVSFDPSGALLASASEDKTVRLWDTRTWESRVAARQEGRVYDVRFLPDGERFGTACSDGTAWIWSVGGEPLVALRGHTKLVRSIDFTRDGEVAATASDDGTVRLWDTRTGRSLWRAPLVLASPPRMLSHLGWLDLADPTRPVDPPGGERWAAALEQDVQIAAVAEDGETLCTAARDGHLELWSAARDERLVRQVAPGITRVIAQAGACIALSEGEGALLLLASGDVHVLSAKAAAIAADAGEILVASGERVDVFGAKGELRRSIASARGASAIARGKNGLVIGFTDGNIQIVGSGGSSRSFEETPPSSVVSLLEGPMDTVIAGFASGAIGVWNARDGKKLTEAKIHGPALHLIIEGHELFAVSELGDHLELDLSVFHEGHCELLRRIWAEVPVVWEHGSPVRRPPPADHPCAR